MKLLAALTLLIGSVTALQDVSETGVFWNSDETLLSCYLFFGRFPQPYWLVFIAPVVLLLLSVAFQGLTCYCKRCPCCKYCIEEPFVLEAAEEGYIIGSDPNCCKDFGKSFVVLFKQSIIAISPAIYLVTIIQQIVYFVLNSVRVHRWTRDLNDQYSGAAYNPCEPSWMWKSYENIFVTVADSGGTLIGIVGILQLLAHERNKLPAVEAERETVIRCKCCCKRTIGDDYVDERCSYLCRKNRLYQFLVLFALSVSLIWFLPLLATHVLVGLLAYVWVFLGVAIVLFSIVFVLSRLCRTNTSGAPFKYALLFFLSGLVQASSHYAVLLYEAEAPISGSDYVRIVADEFIMRDTKCYLYSISQSVNSTAVFEFFLHIGI